MDDIHRVVFPLALGFGARGGPARLTEIATSISGFEQRNTKLSQSRRRYDVGAGIKSVADLETLLTFFEARMGQLYGFLFSDPLDHKSCPSGQNASGADQVIGKGDFEKTHFDLVKTYADSAGSYDRRIVFAKAESVKVQVDGVNAAFTFDAETGKTVLAAAPPAGAVITAGFEFYTPVRFDIDRLDISLETFGAGQAVNIPLVEVLPYVG